MLDSKPYLIPTSFPAIRRGRLQTLQVNLGYRCNQSCQHCHVNAGPNRTEEMDSKTLRELVEFLREGPVETLDLTGGAPELNSGFRDLVEKAHRLGIHVIDRCNLTILEEPGQEDLAEFLAARRVEVVASLPCYLKKNVDAQRGAGVFGRSIRGLNRLNALGYGDGQSGLTLNLVYNPQGASLPPCQSTLEQDYKAHLWDEYGVRFDQLFALANMPIHRFGSTLISKGQLPQYLDLLRGAHSEDNLQSVMCRSLVSIDWRGYVYDCDFNQMLDMPLRTESGERAHVRHLGQIEFKNRPIQVGEHCYGCTAGQGSSCGGALG